MDDKDEIKYSQADVDVIIETCVTGATNAQKEGILECIPAMKESYYEYLATENEDGIALPTAMMEVIKSTVNAFTDRLCAAIEDAEVKCFNSRADLEKYNDEREQFEESMGGTDDETFEDNTEDN